MGIERRDILGKLHQKTSRFTMSLSVLVLGGVGFIGRNFVEYLIQNNLVGSIRVVDKVLPATAYLSASHKEVFADSRVEFRQANLVSQGTFK
jgi:dTDP-D-glucose 4,6-dehydratase